MKYPILEFCRSRPQYEDCLSFLQENPSITIEDILDRGSHHDLFALCDVVPKRFLADLGVFKQELEKKQAFEQEEIQNVANECTLDHPCCHQLRLELDNVKAELDEFRNFISSQFAKFDNPLTNPIKSGDRVLQGSWTLRRRDVLSSASDTSKYDLGTLVDKVFGPGYLTQFGSVLKLPSNVKEAVKVIIDEYAKAKQNAGVGSYDTYLSVGKQKLRRKIANAKYQDDKKEKEKSCSHPISDNISSALSEEKKKRPLSTPLQITLSSDGLNMCTSSLYGNKKSKAIASSTNHLSSSQDSSIVSSDSDDEQGGHVSDIQETSSDEDLRHTPLKVSAKPKQALRSKAKLKHTGTRKASTRIEPEDFNDDLCLSG